MFCIFDKTNLVRVLLKMTCLAVINYLLVVIPSGKMSNALAQYVFIDISAGVIQGWALHKIIHPVLKLNTSYIDATWTSLCFTPLAYWLFVQQLVQAKNEKILKAP